MGTRHPRASNAALDRYDAEHLDIARNASLDPVRKRLLIGRRERAGGYPRFAMGLGDGVGRRS